MKIPVLRLDAQRWQITAKVEWICAPSVWWFLSEMLTPDFPALGMWCLAIHCRGIRGARSLMGSRASSAQHEGVL